METIYQVTGLCVEPWSREGNDPYCDYEYFEKKYYETAKGTRKTIGFYKTMKQAREVKEKFKNIYPPCKDVKIIERSVIELSKGEYALVEKKISFGDS